jgi:hypothetical protein
LDEHFYNTRDPVSVYGHRLQPFSGHTTTISTVIIPYRMIFPDGGVFDATTDLVDGVTPVAGVVNSPLFQPVPWSAGNTQLGTTQFGDAMLRANFWSLIPGNRSGYPVLLSAPKILPVQVINVPDGYGYSTVDSHGVKVGLVDFAWLAGITSSVTVSLGLPPQSLSIHLMSAVEGADLNGSGSLGFHYVVNLGTASNPILQPYLQTGYFSVNSAFVHNNVNASGTVVLGHEVAEWLNDPTVDNVVAAWQEPAFPHICDSTYMEVGDPLTPVSPGIGVSLNGRTYQFPEVAFLSWFSDDRHSTSVNGWYSSLNTFSSPSTACPVYTNFGFVGFDFAGATSSVLTGVNNSVNNRMKIVGYAAAPPSSPIGSCRKRSGSVCRSSMRRICPHGRRPSRSPTRFPIFAAFFSRRLRIGIRGEGGNISPGQRASWRDVPRPMNCSRRSFSGQCGRRTACSKPLQNARKGFEYAALHFVLRGQILWVPLNAD